MGEHVANVVVPGLLGIEADVRQAFLHFGQMLDVQPLHLDIGPRGHVDDAVPIFVSDEGDFAGLVGGQFAGRQPDAVHISSGASRLR